ncbi:MAG TPA: hypothetical protein VNL36_08845, partial [Bacteroidota bacterium]|nr:hypothetical protein [Bacteroidota bacterium]
GTGGTFTIQDTVFNAFSAPVPVSATVAVAAGLRPGFEVAQLAVLPGKTTLQCTDNTPVNVTLKNASGQTVTICGGTTLQATASLEGVGPYAFLRQGTQEGQTIRFPVTASSFSFMAVLDTSRGVIPLGNRQATLRVTVEGVEGTANINLTCPYPPPAVTITHPAQDTTIVLTQNNQPLIILKEEHTPSSGKFEPVISWQPSDRIDTREYFDTMQSGDTVEVQVTVMAENIAQMRAQDTRRVWLVKKGCDDAPECPPVFPVTPPITIVARPNGFAGVNVCEKPTTLGGFAVVTGPQMIAPYEVDACFDRSTGRWRFAVPQGIQLNAVQDLCYENIRRNGQELVSDVTQIPKSECSRALEDFRLHYEYPLGHSVGRMPKYLVAQALLWHEEAHRRFEQRLLSEN